MSAKGYREKPQNVSIDLQDHSVLSNLASVWRMSEDTGTQFPKTHQKLSVSGGIVGLPFRKVAGTQTC